MDGVREQGTESRQSKLWSGAPVAGDIGRSGKSDDNGGHGLAGVERGGCGGGAGQDLNAAAGS